MGLTTITDENKSLRASVERNRRVLTARQLTYMHMRRRESGTKMGQRAVGSKPRLQTCIYYTRARSTRGETKRHNESRRRAIADAF